MSKQASKHKTLMCSIRTLMRSSRLNYILWLQDLLDTTADDFRDGYDPARDVIGLDMYA